MWKMALYTKCILSTPEESDGLRISVMSRHTLADGYTLDSRIIHFDHHEPLLGPLPTLIGSYYKRGLSWQLFESLYLTQLRFDFWSEKVKALSEMAQYFDVTLLCIEASAERCHRRLLAEECQRYNRNLVVKHH
jgi:uncharacterized protein YeaO (DUF488 family)